MRGAYKATLPHTQLLLGTSAETNQDLRPDVRAARLNSSQKEARFDMERLGVAAFWCGTILCGSVLLREAGEFEPSRAEPSPAATRVSQFNTFISWRKVSRKHFVLKFSSPAQSQVRFSLNVKL